MNSSSGKVKGIFKWGDLIILGLLLIATALSLWLALRSTSGQLVEIYKDGVLEYSVSLYEDREIVIDENGYNVIKIENGTVRMIESSCDGQDCVHTAPISSEGGIIVCLPNKIVVRVVSTDVAAIT